MKVTIRTCGGLSKAGYFHLPLLYIAYGLNGFTVSILLIQVIVSWRVKGFNK